MNKIKFPIIISFIVFFVAVFVTAKRLEASILIIVPHPDTFEEQTELEEKRR